MIEVNVYILGENSLLTSYALEDTPAFSVGDFFINNHNTDNFEDDMYLIKAVTHLKPNRSTGNAQISIHVTKYNPKTVGEEVRGVLTRLTSKYRVQTDGV